MCMLCTVYAILCSWQIYITVLLVSAIYFFVSMYLVKVSWLYYTQLKNGPPSRSIYPAYACHIHTYANHKHAYTQPQCI